MARVIAIGEGMLELSGELGGAARLAWGGDTLNTAVYLARLGVSTGFLSALGGDDWSRALRQAWQAEGVDCALVLTHASRVPGLYAIRVDERGERSFTYWRAQSAARALFDCAGIEAALETAGRADALYLSGITLSLFDEAATARLVDLAHSVRARGGAVAFDPNYRARGWASQEAARETFASMMAVCTLGLPTFEDEETLWGDGSPQETLARWRGAGVGEVVVKCGAHGAWFAHAGTVQHVPTPQVRVPVDTTGAGDSFNAAYLAARLRGADPAAAAGEGHRLAGAVVMARGAILARDGMPMINGVRA